VASYPDSTKASLEQRLRARARERWPQITTLQIRHRGTFSYIEATLTGATALKLCRLRYVGSARHWQFAIYRASHDDYDESIFPAGLLTGSPIPDATGSILIGVLLAVIAIVLTNLNRRFLIGKGGRPAGARGHHPGLAGRAGGRPGDLSAAGDRRTADDLGGR